MLSEISQSEKDNYHMISLICGTKEIAERIICEGRKNGRGINPRGRKTPETL